MLEGGGEHVSSPTICLPAALAASHSQDLELSMLARNLAGGRCLLGYMREDFEVAAEVMAQLQTRVFLVDLLLDCLVLGEGGEGHLDPKIETFYETRMMAAQLSL